MAKIVTVFGASGFLGKHVVRRLVTAGYTVRAAVRSPEQAKFLKTMGDPGQVVPMAAPVQSKVAVRAAIKDADAVINLVGIMFPRGPQQFSDVHVESVKFMAKAVKDFDVESFVHVSAIGADSKSESTYACSKGDAEKIIRKQTPFATILRPSIICGPEDNFFNLFASMAKYAPILPVIGGQTKFQPVYVENVAEAIVRAVQMKDYQGETYEIGGPKTYTFKELMQLMLKTTGYKACLMPVPFWAAHIKAAGFELFRIPILTRDQVKLLKHDNVVAQKAKTLADMGVKPMPIEPVIASYLP